MGDWCDRIWIVWSDGLNNGWMGVCVIYLSMITNAELEEYILFLSFVFCFSFFRIKYSVFSVFRPYNNNKVYFAVVLVVIVVVLCMCMAENLGGRFKIHSLFRLFSIKADIFIHFIISYFHSRHWGLKIWVIWKWFKGFSLLNILYRML